MDFCFKRIAIINRGESAMRFLRALEEINGETTTPIASIAFYTAPDAQSMFVRNADEQFCLGQATFVDTDGHRKSSYLNLSLLEEALIKTKADAAWVGWGFVAEDAEFADLCARLGVNFIGPSGAVMRRLGDKIASKKLAEAADVPVSAWSGGALNSLKEAQLAASKLGYPLMLKATAGGGGRGIRRVLAPSDLDSAFESARAEARKSFGNDAVFLEKMVIGARHIEVQIVADTHGNVFAAGVRDCTIQRKNQKVVEEAPSPVLSAKLDAEIKSAAVRLAKKAGYFNVGTAEFLFSPETEQFCFMEMNTRLQVEHPVTELTTGIDLVKMQLRIANREKIKSISSEVRGHAIEVRLNAEDPAAGFAPAPGYIRYFVPPTGPGIRVDTGVGQGDEISPDFDSMVAKIIAFGNTRSEALSRLSRALRETVVVVEGGTTNKSFLLDLISSPDLIANKTDIGWLDRREPKRANPFAEIAVIAAGIEIYEQEHEIECQEFLNTAYRGRPVCRQETSIAAEVSIEGQALRIEIEKYSSQKFGVTYKDTQIMVNYRKRANCESLMTINEIKHKILCVAQGAHFLIEVDGIAHRVSRDTGGLLRSPSAAIVLSVLVKPGDLVKVGDRLLVLEAMKMETNVLAQAEGRIKEVFATPNTQVGAGAPLLVLEAESKNVSEDKQVTFSWPSNTSVNENINDSWLKYLASFEALILGYDINYLKIKKSQLDLLKKEQISLLNSESVFARELELLEKSAIFFDLSFVNGKGSDEQWHEPKDCLINFMRKFNPEEKTLPAIFTKNLQQMCKLFEIDKIERNKKLEESLWAIWRSFIKIEQIAEIVSGIFARHLQCVQTGIKIPQEFETCANRILAAIDNKLPALSNLISLYQFRSFEEPVVRNEHLEACENLIKRLHILESQDDISTDEIQELAECPWPVVNFILEQMAKSVAPQRRWLQEILVRHFYRDRNFEATKVHYLNDYVLLQMPYKLKDSSLELICTAAPSSVLENILTQIWQQFTKPVTSGDVLVDLFLWGNGSKLDGIELKNRVLKFLNAQNIQNPIKRLCVYAATPGGVQPSLCLTFRWLETIGYVEDVLSRDIHPLEAKRFELWRYGNFEVSRVASAAEDIFVFRARSKENEKDDRLLVFSEVRDATPFRSHKNGSLELPYFERRFIDACMTIREVLNALPPRERPRSTSLNLFIVPTLVGQQREISSLIRRIIPHSEHLNIEQVSVRGRAWNKRLNKTEEWSLEVSANLDTGLRINRVPALMGQITPKTKYEQKVLAARERGLFYSYELLRAFTNSDELSLPHGSFIEYDLADDTSATSDKFKKMAAYGKTLVPINREIGANTCNLVVGTVSHKTQKYPEGMVRVCVVSDPSFDMGSLAEPECIRLILAMNLAESMGVPLEWFAVSSGAKIAMDSGTENLDWTARTLKRIVEFTQKGFEINVVVTGINVGAQAYWDAEATMHMHTRGILIMLPEAAIVLTGKKALDYSGGVSAENNQGIGGAEQIMGPNGQAQYSAKNLSHAFAILLQYYEHSYKAPLEKFPRSRISSDPITRDVGLFPHLGDFKKVGDIFSDTCNPGRKKPFDIRTVMRSVTDMDSEPLERWQTMRNAETAVVWDAHVGGHPLLLLGVESRPLLRYGAIPGDGPDTWTGGTMFPNSSKKLARAINSASGNRPIAILANLSGFDGSPESMRLLQLEYGSELGRAVVNCKSPIFVCVLTRFHGGAYVVFSQALNPSLEIIALEGSFASVIGGTPAAAVVFPGEVKAKTYQDAKIKEIQSRLKDARKEERLSLLSEFNELYKKIYLEKQAELAQEFDKIHSIDRAKQVGSISAIVNPASFREYLAKKNQGFWSRVEN